MGVICSGPQNSGTYLLTKCVELMGFERVYGNVVDDVITFNQWDRPVTIKERIWDEPYKTQGQTQGLEWLEQNLFDNCCIHAHSPRYIKGHKNVFILRDPRNVILSRLRRRIREDHPTLKNWGVSPNFTRQDNFFMYMKKAGESVVEKIDTYFQIDRGFRVYYEYLKHPTTLRNLAKYLETDDIPSVYGLHGKTLTWSGHPSEYQKWWSKEIEILFESIGGNDLVRRMGYAATRR